MRKITEQIVRAFRNGEAKTIGNSRTENGALYLFGNKIAEYRDGALWITNAGWKSNTTKERLNGLPNVRIYQSRGEWYLNGIEWNGEWVEVGTLWHRELPNIEVEFDVTSQWTGAYSKPIYSVYHTNEENGLIPVENRLNDALIPFRRMESDTAGAYKPNYFLVVMPSDFERAKRLTDEL